MKAALCGRLVGSALLLLLFNLQIVAEPVQIEGEDWKRLVGEVADLREANLALQRRVGQLQLKTDALEGALRDVNDRSIENLGTVASREDLSKMAEKFSRSREADQKLIVEQFEKLSVALSSPSETPVKIAKSKEAGVANSKGFEGNVIKYKVEPGDMLEKVLKAYNQRLKDEGRPRVNAGLVVAANPGLNPDNLLAGREILLPVPDKSAGHKIN